jgi:hypothetical protein
MHNRDKDFTDKLGPLKRWIASRVGRNWDRVYSELKQAFPNTNKQNHHLIETHLLGYVRRDVIVEKSEAGRKVYEFSPYRGRAELFAGDIYVDPATHVVMRYKGKRAAARAASAP